MRAGARTWTASRGGTRVAVVEARPALSIGRNGGAWAPSNESCLHKFNTAAFPQKLPGWLASHQPQAGLCDLQLLEPTDWDRKLPNANIVVLV